MADAACPTDSIVPEFAVCGEHYQCYEAEGENVNVTVSLDDQFEFEPNVKVKEPELGLQMVVGGATTSSGQAAPGTPVQDSSGSQRSPEPGWQTSAI